ncbi:hypothetical protein D3C80_2117290 [compost metagenome]
MYKFPPVFSEMYNNDSNGPPPFVGFIVELDINFLFKLLNKGLTVGITFKILFAKSSDS